MPYVVYPAQPVDGRKAIPVLTRARADRLVRQHRGVTTDGESAGWTPGTLPTVARRIGWMEYLLRSIRLP